MFWNSNKIPHFAWTGMVFTILISGMAFLYFENVLVNNLVYFRINGHYGIAYPDILTIKGLYALYFLLALWLVELLGTFRKQKIHNQASGLFYYSFGAFLAPLTSFLLSKLLLRFLGLNILSFITIWPRVIPAVSIIIIFLLIKKSDPTKESWRFASGAVNAVNDRFSFQAKAINEKIGLSEIKKYISVVGLYGDYGFGKSSFARMIIENFDKSSTLYTYISLTETNEATDFSKLFSERWLETLKSRYPILDSISYLPMMQSVLRESGNGIISEIIGWLSKSNFGLTKTLAKYWDPYFNRVDSFTSEDIGKIFANIPEIKEDIWIILIDEMERAQFDEIYRAIEVIERFKNEGRSGLPVKLIFLLCISRNDLRDLTETFKDKQPTAYLINNFFFTNPKTITHTIFLPPVSLEERTNYLVGEIRALLKTEKVDDNILFDSDKLTPDTLTDPSRGFITESRTALEYVLGALTNESPRMMKRVLEEAQFFYQGFRDKSGERSVDRIRLPDILAISYIRIKYPFVIDFFIKTIPEQVIDDNFRLWLMRDRLKEKRRKLMDWVQEETNVTLNDKQKDEVEKLIGLVAYFYFDSLKESNKEKDKIYRDGTLSYPELMYDYLNKVSGSIDTSYLRNHQLYLKHTKSGDAFLKETSNLELLTYSRFLGDIYPDQEFHIAVAREIKERILSKKIEAEPGKIGDTILDEAVYQLIFRVVSLLQFETEQDPRPIEQEAFELLDAVLRFNDLPTGIKFIIINSLANDERGGGSIIHHNLAHAFQKLMSWYEDRIRNVIKHVFEEYEERYFTGSDIIYSREENFFYVFYQGWSGNSNATHAIEKIRSVAVRGLKERPNVIKAYWQSYPIKPEWKKAQDILKHNVFLDYDKNKELYITLQELVNITKQVGIRDPEIVAKMALWEQTISDERFQEKRRLVDDRATLRNFLIRRGLL